MSAHPLAGQAVPESLRINVLWLVVDYYTVTPDPAVPDQVVSFGTSGHRGSSFRASFNAIDSNVRDVELLLSASKSLMKLSRYREALRGFTRAGDFAKIGRAHV